MENLDKSQVALDTPSFGFSDFADHASAQVIYVRLQYRIQTWAVGYNLPSVTK